MILKEGKITKSIIEENPQLIGNGMLPKIQQSLAIYKQICLEEEEEKKESWWPSEYPFNPQEK